MADDINIVFLGDVVGRPGRKIVKDFLTEDFESTLNIKKENTFLIANVENASHGFGLTQKNYEDFVALGINCLTSGNHIWDKKDIFQYIDNAEILLRPMNYPEGTKGFGHRVFNFNNVKIGVINLLGRVFMNPVDSQWACVLKAIDEIKKETPIIFIDFHAEATAEKICFAKYCSELGVSMFVGTHTHIQTADEKIMNNQTAYITDAGFCGDADGVIGMEYHTSKTRLMTNLPERFDIAATKNCELDGVFATIGLNGKAKTIKRFCIQKNYEEKEQ